MIKVKEDLLTENHVLKMNVEELETQIENLQRDNSKIAHECGELEGIITIHNIEIKELKDKIKELEDK